MICERRRFYMCVCTASAAVQASAARNSFSDMAGHKGTGQPPKGIWAAVYQQFQRLSRAGEI